MSRRDLYLAVIPLSGQLPGADDVALVAMTALIAGSARTPAQHHDGLVDEPEPSIDLTPATTHALTRLQPTPGGKRGVHLRTVTPLQQWSQAVDREQLAAHLGIALPVFPVLTARGYRTSYRSREGAQVFEHPVPSASRPPAPTGPGSNSHSVLIVHVADGVDPGAVTLTDAGSLGVGWMQLNYGPPQRQRSPEEAAEIAALEALPRPDLTRLAFRDGTPIWVVRSLEEQTTAGWRCTVKDAAFTVTVVLPLPPLQAVQALANTPGIPLQPR